MLILQFWWTYDKTPSYFYQESDRSVRGKRKRVSNARGTHPSSGSDTPSYNFSEFDDYSLLVSSPSKHEDNLCTISPPNLRSKKKTSNIDVKTSTPFCERSSSKEVVNSSGKKDVETSTPLAKRTRNGALTEITNYNISLISNIERINHVEDSPQQCDETNRVNVRGHVTDDIDDSNIVKSPAIFMSEIYEIPFW